MILKSQDYIVSISDTPHTADCPNLLFFFQKWPPSESTLDETAMSPPAAHTLQNIPSTTNPRHKLLRLWFLAMFDGCQSACLPRSPTPVLYQPPADQQGRPFTIIPVLIDANSQLHTSAAGTTAITRQFRQCAPFCTRCLMVPSRNKASGPMN